MNRGRCQKFLILSKESTLGCMIGGICLLLPATKLGKGYVFTGMCDSVHRGGVSASGHAGMPHPPGADTPSGADILSRRHPQEQTPPPPGADTPPM